MQLQLVKPSTAALAGLLLTVPALYFFLSALLKYGFHMPVFLDAFEPFLHGPAADNPVAWSLNLLLLFGPLLSFLLNLAAIADVSVRQNREAVHVSVSLQRRGWNWTALVLSGACLCVTLLYGLAENCAC